MPNGLYWIRFFPDDVEWQPAQLVDGEWFLIGVADGMPRVAEVGPPIPVHTAPPSADGQA